MDVRFWVGVLSSTLSLLLKCPVLRRVSYGGGLFLWVCRSQIGWETVDGLFGRGMHTIVSHVNKLALYLFMLWLRLASVALQYPT